jgi:hypothetical protein
MRFWQNVLPFIPSDGARGAFLHEKRNRPQRNSLDSINEWADSPRNIGRQSRAGKRKRATEAARSQIRNRVRRGR